MARGYSKDLRVRVVSIVEDGVCQAIEAVCAIYRPTPARIGDALTSKARFASV